MFEFAAFALFLGIKHSFDADHLIAVSNLLSRAKSLKSSVKMSIHWAAGHMLTAAIITAILFTFKDAFLSLVLGKFELLVGLMLVFLGLLSIWNSRILHAHAHSHGGMPHVHWHTHLRDKKEDHAHRHMFGIGVVHGLASNDELLILITASLGLSTLADMMFGVAIFSAGVVIGMIAFSILFTYPVLKLESEKFNQLLSFGVGCISIIYGFFMFLGL